MHCDIASRSLGVDLLPCARRRSQISRDQLHKFAKDNGHLVVEAGKRKRGRESAEAQAEPPAAPAEAAAGAAAKAAAGTAAAPAPAPAPAAVSPAPPAARERGSSIYTPKSMRRMANTRDRQLKRLIKEGAV